VAKLRVGVELATLPYPFKEALEKAAELGAEAVELEAKGELAPGQLSSSGIREIRHWLEDYGLRLSALRLPLSRGFDSPEELERRIATTKTAMETAYKLGAFVVLCPIGQVPQDQQSPRWRLLAEVMDELSRHGNRVGAQLAVETGTEPGERLASLLNHLPEGTIGADLNPGNLKLAGFSPEEAAVQLGRRILHVHATDASADLPGSRGRFCPLGLGGVDWLHLLATLEEFNYRGWFIVTSPPGCDPETEIPRAIGFLRRL